MVALPGPRNSRRVANKSRFISTQQTFSYSFQTSTFASFRKKWTSKIHRSKRITSNPIIDRSFPDGSTALRVTSRSNNTNNNACSMSEPTGQEPCGGDHTIHGQTPRDNMYTRPGSNHRSICKQSTKKRGTSGERHLPGSVEHFLSLQHSYSKFGVFRSDSTSHQRRTTEQRSFSNKTKQTKTTTTRSLTTSTTTLQKTQVVESDARCSVVSAKNNSRKGQTRVWTNDKI